MFRLCTCATCDVGVGGGGGGADGGADGVVSCCRVGVLRCWCW